ncbi:MAG: hypothetical protein E6K24_02245 [Gammaproteobacteria bacterium]|nr:MAG: hypothetical protein E6K24_02245 [Gammaproteobacteria bacterium]
MATQRSSSNPHDGRTAHVESNSGYATSGEYTWYIDKCIKRVGRLCESTGTADRDEAERYLLHRIRELRDIAIHGVRPRRKFHEAAAK